MDDITILLTNGQRVLMASALRVAADKYLEDAVSSTSTDELSAQYSHQMEGCLAMAEMVENCGTVAMEE